MHLAVSSNRFSERAAAAASARAEAAEGPTPLSQPDPRRPPAAAPRPPRRLRQEGPQLGGGGGGRESGGKFKPAESAEQPAHCEHAGGSEEQAGRCGDAEGVKLSSEWREIQTELLVHFKKLESGRVREPSVCETHFWRPPCMSRREQEVSHSNL